MAHGKDASNISMSQPGALSGPDQVIPMMGDAYPEPLQGCGGAQVMGPGGAAAQAPPPQPTVPEVAQGVQMIRQHALQLPNHIQEQAMNQAQ